MVGHNLFRFDYKVLWGAPNRAERLPISLAAHRKEEPHRANMSWAGIATIDTLASLKEITGRFLALDNLGMSTLKRGKTDGMSGELAPQMLREGRWREVAAYCRDDVALIRDLFRWGVTKGTIWYVDMRTRKPRYAQPTWASTLAAVASTRGTKVKARKRKR